MPPYRLVVISQVAPAVGLVILAGITVRTLGELYQRDIGFDAGQIVAAHVILPPTPASTSQPMSNEERRGRQTAAMATFLERLRALPGVIAAEVINHWPFAEVTLPKWFDDANQPVEREAAWRAALNVVSPGYFALMGISLVEGRLFTSVDLAPGPRGLVPARRVTVISQSLATKLWPDGRAVGRFIGDDLIVGVVRDVRFGGFEANPLPRMYIPYAQRPQSNVLVVMLSADPAGAIRALRAQASQSFGAGTPVFAPLTGEQLLRQWLGDQRVTTTLVTTFGAVALLLAIVGVYAVLWAAVTASRREIGIRVALGASRRHLTGWLCRQIAVPVVIGAAVGLASAAVVARILDSIFFGAATFSMSTAAGVVITLLGAGALAATLPLIHAFRVDPVSLLRAE
jgi:hypothetical protein